MARELSQAELLDFLCQAGGRVSNAALLGHFRRFLRDPAAGPEELRRRRELFKGCVNSVATVRQEEPGGAKFVVLRKRYRELVGEEPRAPNPEPPNPSSEPGPPRGAPPPDLGRSGCRREPPRGPSGGQRACGAAEPRVEPAGDGQPPWQRRPGGPEALPGLPGREEGRPVAGCSVGGGMSAPPGVDSAQQRIRDWLGTHHHPSNLARRSPPSPEWRNCPPPHSLDPSLEGLRCHPPVPVFRSIRCQLSLQDLEDFIEQESSASEGGSSTSGGSDSCRPEGEIGRLQARLAGQQKVQNRTGTPRPEGPRLRPRGGGSVAVSPLAKESIARPNGTVPGHLALLSQVANRANKPWVREAEEQGRDQPKAKKVPGPPPQHLETPSSPLVISRHGPAAHKPALEGPVPDAEGSTEHRSSLVPLDAREHAWLVKVATGSWMQARALLLEDPHLATRKDFISGYTVLHWLAKHGNDKVLQDFITGAQKAGVPLDVNVTSGCGYTPLHLAAMHGHQRVIKVLVQQLQCRVHVRDSSGKRPWQYLSSSTSGEVWQLLGAPRGKTIFPAHPIIRNANGSPARKGKSPELARKISRKASLAAYLKPQHIKWKMGNKCPPLHEREEYSD